ncbi:MAG: acetylornithine transaminase, partial [Bradyrhizobium sp.]
DVVRPIAPSIVAEAFELGLLLNAPRADTLRFMPALNVTRDEIAAMIETLDGILTKLGAARCVA